MPIPDFELPLISKELTPMTDQGGLRVVDVRDGVLQFDHTLSGNALTDSDTRQFDITYYNDRFKHFAFPADGDDIPGADRLLRCARETHSEGYLEGSLVKPPAIKEGNRLIPDVDKSKGKPGEAFLAAHPENGADRATARLMDAAPRDGKHGFELLPTFAFCSDGISSECKDMMAGMEESGVVWRELSALARIGSDSSGLSTIEMFRHVLHRTIGRNQMLYCSMVSPVYDHLSKTLSPRNLEVVGERVILDETDFRVKTELVPVVIAPDEFIPRLVRSYELSIDAQDRERYKQTALFMAQGLPREMVPECIYRLAPTRVPAQHVGGTALAS